MTTPDPYTLAVENIRTYAGIDGPGYADTPRADMLELAQVQATLAVADRLGQVIYELRSLGDIARAADYAGGALDGLTQAVRDN